MTFMAVAAPVHQHTEIASNPNTVVTPASVSSQLGGAAILTVLALMVVTGFSAAGMGHKATKPSKHPRFQGHHHPAH